MRKLLSGNITGVISIIFCFLVYCAVSIDMMNTPIDDVYISLRYVWNFIHGNGLTFNPGEYVEGYSNPTWIFLLSFIAKILSVNSKYELIIVNKILSFVVLFSAYIYFYKSLKIYFKGNLISFLFLFALCSSYVLNSYALIGMEFPLVLLFLALFFYYYNKYLIQNNKTSLLVSSAFLGFLSISRPEGIIYIAAFMVSIIIYQYRFENRTIWIALKKSISFSFLSIIIFCAFIIFRLYYYGEFMPNTAAAKNYFNLETLIRGSHYILAGIFLGLGVFLSLAVFQINKITFDNYKQVFILTGIVILAQFSFILYTGWDWMISFRFILPLLPLIIFILFLNKKLHRNQLIWVLLILLIPQIYFQRYYIRNIGLRTSGFSEISLVSTGYEDVSVFLNSIKKPDDLMLIQEAGYVPYATDIRTLDLCGLTDKHLASIHAPHFKVLDLEYTLFYKKPSIIVTFQTLYDEKSKSYNSEKYFQSNAVLQSNVFKERYKNVYYNYGVGVFVFKDRELQ